MRFPLLIALAVLACTASIRPANTETLDKGRSVLDADSKKSDGLRFWLESSLKRVYLTSKPGPSQGISLVAARNGQVSFQACVRNERAAWLGARCSVTGEGDLKIQVRRVDYVPVRYPTSGTDASELDGVSEGHYPGYVPDILYPSQTSDVGSYQTAPFWITVRVPADARPGRRELTINWDFDEEPRHVEFTATIDVSSFVIEPRRDFRVSHWWRSECLWDYYKTGMYEDEKHWEITRNYIRNLVGHGTDTVFVPIFFVRRVPFERPAQLLKVSEPEPGRYVFDFSDVRRFVRLARECGAQYFEWSHLWIYWGVENPIRVYTWKDGKATMLWPPDSDGHGEVYHNFLRQFLPEFHKFLVSENLLERSFFHLSDEPGGGQHIENYKRARSFLRETAPWMKVIDALSDIQYGRQGLTDMPIVLASAAQPYIDENIPHWIYLCCVPTGPHIQRFLDTPLPKLRMAGWLFYRLGAKGYLHWGYNYWHAGEEEKMADVFGPPGLAPGDNFVVYPGSDGRPMDSIRWEVFAESLQDYAILQTAGIKPSDPMLTEIKDYATFPKSAEWIDKSLARVLLGKQK